MKAIIQTVNKKGLQEIHNFLGKYHKLGFSHFDHSMLLSWAADAEFQLGEGNGAEIEIRSFDSVSGTTKTYLISEDGLDSQEVEIDD